MPLSSSQPEVSEAISALELALAQASPAQLPSVCGELERLRALLWVRMMTPPGPAADTPGLVPEDQYLTMQQVKKRTGLSLSYLYELARIGVLKARAMGRGGRGYRVLMSDLLAWEASLPKDAVASEVSKMLRRWSRDRPGVPTPPQPARAHTGGARSEARRPSDHAVPMGAGRERHPATRGTTDPATQAGQAVV